MMASDDSLKVYDFKVLLPNGATVELRLSEKDEEIPFERFIEKIRGSYIAGSRQDGVKGKRIIDWKSDKLYIEDAKDRKIKSRINLRVFEPLKCHILRLHDGSGETVQTFENMWDLTPDIDLLMELPEEYNFESALADLIDNSLQAVWGNDKTDKRLISVEVLEDKISIFDSGPGMDCSDENSIVKWGKMGASLNRLSKSKAIGCKPPYLVPFFGMFGYGGAIASMHIGRCAKVSSKTKESKKVYVLRLARESLLSNTNHERTWKTDGDIRDPTKDEIGKSPHQSFTKVEINELKCPKLDRSDLYKLKCKLKDIYFPYIQSDELSNVGRTVTPVEFQVNGSNLAGIKGGETATTLLHSCNGPEFTMQLHFSLKMENVVTEGSGSKGSQEANARLKCIYFPIRQGKENIERILEILDGDKLGVRENFEKFSRVSIRRLGRLLPDARWDWLPFMDLRMRKGERSNLLKRCCRRVKCFVETDAGFNPLPSKNNLAHHNPFTIALKEFGNRHEEKERDVNIEIYRDKKQLTFLQLEREYQNWLLRMHELYDEEIDSGEDQPVHVISPSNKKALGISSEIIRVHGAIKRKGVSWRRGQKIKVIKGACAGFHRNNVFATLEYILIEGLQGDFGGEAQIVCRPLGKDDGCVLSVKDGNTSLDIRDSLSFPVSVIDSGKCLAIDDAEWDNQLKKHLQKVPSRIDLLSVKQCYDLEINGALPADCKVIAGVTPPKEIVAVIRPRSFDSCSLNGLDQNSIVKIDLEMSMEVKFRRKKNADVKHIYAVRVAPSSRNRSHGLYIFQLRSKLPRLFEQAGEYIFSLSLVGYVGCQKCKKQLVVVPSDKFGKWMLLTDAKNPSYNIRVGSYFPLPHIACYDIYNNRMPFLSIPNLNIKPIRNDSLLVDMSKVKPSLSSDNLVLHIENVIIESCELDSIRPHYAATLLISTIDETLSVSVECQVTPGALQVVKTCPEILGRQLLPGFVIEHLVLEMFDAQGNHVEEGLEVQFHLDGFCIQGQTGSKWKVDDRGCVDLGGQLKVTAAYGKPVSLSVLYDDQAVFKQEFQTERRELRILSMIPKHCIAGSTLENLVFEIVDSEGVVDKSFHDDEKCGLSHTLMVTSELFEIDDSVRYAFRQGCCVVTSIPLPQTEGPLSFIALHSRHKELYVNVKVSLVRASKIEFDEFSYPSTDANLLLTQNSQSVRSGENVLSLVNHQKAEHISPILTLDPKDEMFKYGKRIARYEHDLESLACQKAILEDIISGLQASLDSNVIDNLDSLVTKEEMMQLIMERDDSAASVLYSPSQKLPFEEPRIYADIIGVVALLGMVRTSSLSRILAQYLGEDQMLAIVCKCYETAHALENYLHNRKFLVIICLEDTRPYTGNIEELDPQRKLALPDPRLPTGDVPPGFIGYAVNMVDVDHLHLKNLTSTGLGLRETLLYGLFGKLQVYETKEYLEKARPLLEDGGVSLDGRIMRKNGVVSVRCRNPEIYFPVQTQVSPQYKEILEKMTEKKLEQRKILHGMELAERKLDKSLSKFNKKKRKLNEQSDRMEKYLSPM